jgi:hypothetical protein
MNENKDTNPPAIKRLNGAKVRSLAEARERLALLLSKAVVEKNDDKEIAGLTNYIGNTMLEHCGEFLGAWQLASTEYQPLVLAIGKLLSRASAAIAPAPAIETEIVDAKPQPEVAK